MFTARIRRKFHFTVFLIALIPGGIMSLLFPHSLAWIVFMSWCSFWYAPLTSYSGETPVEEEGKDEEVE